MAIHARTRHDKDFDIFTHPMDPTKSPYAHYAGYTDKLAAFYAQLGITSAIWASPEEPPPKYVERCKQYEYILRLNESRVVAYVNESTWSPYIFGERDDFEYSVTPVQYEDTSLIISTPLVANEVVLFRQYRNLNGPDRFEVIEERPFTNGAAAN